MTEPMLETTDETPLSVRAARALFFLMGAVWLLFGLISLLRSPALFMFINAALSFWIGWGIGKQIRRYFYFGILFIGANIFLSATDVFRLFDIITLVIDVILLGLLLLTRAHYTADKGAADSGPGMG